MNVCYMCDVVYGMCVMYVWCMIGMYIVCVVRVCGVRVYAVYVYVCLYDVVYGVHAHRGIVWKFEGSFQKSALSFHLRSLVCPIASLLPESSHQLSNHTREAG